MKTSICFAYPWATFGGCERIFINRAMAFKEYFPNIRVDFLFMADGGGLKSFSAALSRYGLTETASIVSTLDRPYDLVSLVDCPQLFGVVDSCRQRFIVECHTDYANNRAYLASLPSACGFVAVPSTRFGEVLGKEFPSLRGRILDLANFVPWDVSEYQPRGEVFLPGWHRKPILFFGRMDELKNPKILLDAFKVLEKRRPGEFMLLLCGPKSSEIDIDSEILRRGLSDKAVVLPPVPFHAASTILESVRRANGIFVSPSRGESFGLSAAEAISALLPAVLSNIDAHRDLMGDLSARYLFDLDDVDDLVGCIEYVSTNYVSVQNDFRARRLSFSAERFIKDWKNLFEKVFL